MLTLHKRPRDAILQRNKEIKVIEYPKRYEEACGHEEEIYSGKRQRKEK
jgi:hypothetical protein